MLTLFSANINHRTVTGEEQLPIHYAARYDSKDAFGILLEKGADPLARDAMGKTPLFLAAEAGKSHNL